MTGGHDSGDESILRAFVNHARESSLESPGQSGLTAAKRLIFDAVGVGHHRREQNPSPRG